MFRVASFQEVIRHVCSFAHVVWIFVFIISINRYLDILPNPKSRVELPLLVKDNGQPDPTSEYINANWVRGADGDVGGSKRFIAAMGPKPGTVYNFWRMLYLHKPVS